MNKLGLILTLSVSMSFSSLATNQKMKVCTVGNLVTQMQCLDQAIIKEQRARDTWLTKLESNVEVKQNNTGNTQLFLSFQRAKNSFDAYVSDNCQWRYLNELPNTKQAALQYKRCELTITKQQIEILKSDF